MKMVTYLLGAGASADVLPVAAKMEERLNVLLSEDDGSLGKAVREAHGVANYTNDILLPWRGGQYGMPFTGELIKLREIAKEHPTLDTHARMLWTKNGMRGDGQEQYDFKALLACYFLLLQTKDRKVDPRYELFFGPRLDAHGEDHTVPALQPNIRILTWNYDIQLEKAYNGFVSDRRYAYEVISQSDIVQRLNGSCITLFDYAYAQRQLGTVFGGFTKDTIPQIRDFYNDMRKNPQPGIHFAWETEDGPIEDKVYIIARNTEVLVVCGYSFPDFNKYVDHLILTEMKRLNKIYVQVLSSDFESVKKGILRAFWEPRNDIEIVPVHETIQFPIPPEME
jgi:hypothetical protein